MVLSLVELSLRAITNGIKNGTIRHPHLLPPKLRERVLDTAIRQGVSDHPNAMEILTSVEFLIGMTSITAKACNDSDLIFLERLISSLATKLPDGETIGTSIKKLNITVYDYGARQSNFKNEKTYWGIISKVSDLIGHCLNTVSMDLYMRRWFTKIGYWPLNENENSACNRVMENLIKLSVLCNGEHIVDRNRPIINFNQLTTLELDNCYFDNGSLHFLLVKIPFVENLHFFDVSSMIYYGLDWTLLSKLPHLKSLTVFVRRTIFECNKAFVDTLMECPRLRQVHLKLDQTSTDEESLLRLASMDIDLKIKIRLFVHYFTDLDFDSSSRFKLVSIFNERVESLELKVWKQWTTQFSTALEDVFNTCPNLTSFSIQQPEFGPVTRLDLWPSPLVKFEETKRFNAALVRFFSTPERAQHLEGLHLDGNFDEIVLSAVFENCLNLVRLNISDCPNLRDQHFIDWVSRGGGGKLTDIIVIDCKNITRERIIPILTERAEYYPKFENGAIMSVPNSLINDTSFFSP